MGVFTVEVRVTKPGRRPRWKTLEECRNQLAEVVEEWLLIRVANRLPAPRLGKIAIRVTMAG